jgi:hypothetical protein
MTAGPNLAEWISAGAAAFTMIAAIMALIVAWRAPKMAAQFAEDLRNQNEAANERTRLRMHVFTNLMKCRSQILHRDALDAINLVDVAFPDDVSVRSARKSFTAATLEVPHHPIKIVERYHALIDKVATAVGFGPCIGPSDIQSGYYPTALGRMDEAAIVEAEDKIARASAGSQRAIVP